MKRIIGNSQPNGAVRLRERKASFAGIAGLLDDLCQPLAVGDPAGAIVFANRALAELTGYTPDDLLGIDWRTELTPPEWIDRVDAHLSDLARTGSPVRFEQEWRTRDGALVPVEMLVQLQRDDSGNPLYFAFATDLRRRRTTEMALRESEERFRSLFENSLDAVFLTYADGRIIAANPAARSIFGMTEGELVAAGRSGAIAPDDPRLTAAVEERTRTGRVRCELTFVRKDGSRFEGETTSVVVGPGGRAFVIVRDISEHKRNEGALLASERRFRSVVDSNMIGVFFYKPSTGEITDANDEFLRITGRTRQELAACALTLAGIAAAAEPKYQAILAGAEARGGRIAPFTMECRRGDGARIPVTFGGQILDDALSGVAFAIEETERRLLEQRLKHAQKLESVAHLAAGIGHKFNNLLSIVIGYASIAMQESDSRNVGVLAEIADAAQQASNLTQQILSYAGKGQFFGIERLDCGVFLRRLEEPIRLSVREDIDLRMQFHERLPPVLMDPLQFRQIVMILAVNASEAVTGPGAWISISNGLESLEQPFVDAAGNWVEVGTYAYVDVSDNGVGIEPDIAGRIFEPFFTTKFTGRGLGLAVLDGIVRSLKGGVVLTSAPGAGSRFRVYLPI